MTAGNNQKSICIDALRSPTNDLWRWANPETVPDWLGPYCFTIIDELTTHAEQSPNLPVKTELHQNYPNPFNPTTSIGFELSEKAEVVLSIFSITGQLVFRQQKGYPAGHHLIEWDGSDYPSGVYFYRLQTDYFSASRKMLLLK